MHSSQEYNNFNCFAVWFNKYCALFQLVSEHTYMFLTLVEFFLHQFVTE